MQANRSTRLHRILEDTKEADGEADIREKMQILGAQLSDSISNVHEVFMSQIFVAICRAFWDKMGQVKLDIPLISTYSKFIVTSYSCWCFHSSDCIKISGGPKGESSLVQWIISCFGGKYSIPSHFWFDLKTCSLIWITYRLSDSGWHLCIADAAITRKRITRERCRAPSFYNWSSIYSIERYNK